MVGTFTPLAISPAPFELILKHVGAFLEKHQNYYFNVFFSFPSFWHSYSWVVCVFVCTHVHMCVRTHVWVCLHMWRLSEFGRCLLQSPSVHELRQGLSLEPRALGFRWSTWLRDPVPARRAEQWTSHPLASVWCILVWEVLYPLGQLLSPKDHFL